MWAAVGSYSLCLGLTLLLGEEALMSMGMADYAVGLMDGVYV